MISSDHTPDTPPDRSDVDLADEPAPTREAALTAVNESLMRQVKRNPALAREPAQISTETSALASEPIQMPSTVYQPCSCCHVTCGMCANTERDNTEDTENQHADDSDTESADQDFPSYTINTLIRYLSTLESATSTKSHNSWAMKEPADYSLSKNVTASWVEIHPRMATSTTLDARNLKMMKNHYLNSGKRVQRSIKAYMQKTKILEEQQPQEEEEEDVEVQSKEEMEVNAEELETPLHHFSPVVQDLIIPTKFLSPDKDNPDWGGTALLELRAQRDLELARLTFVNLEAPGQKWTRPDESKKLARTHAFEYVTAARATTDVNWVREHVDYAFDTGATSHVTYLKKAISNPRSTRMTITGVSGGAERLDAEGQIVGQALDDHGGHVELELPNAVLHKRANMNLLSASQMIKQGTVVHLETGNSYIIVYNTSDTGKITRSKIPLLEKDGLFILQLSHLVPENEIKAALAAGSVLEPLSQDHDDNVTANIGTHADLSLWHRRLGHLDKKTIRVMFEKKVYEGLTIKDLGKGCDSKCTCETCATARATKQPVHKTPRYDTHLYGIPFRRVQVDLKGPLVKGFGNYRYTASFICSESRYGKTYYLARKSDAHLALRDFLADVKAMGYATPVSILTDNGTEFVTGSKSALQAGQEPRLSKFGKICKKHKIEHIKTPAYKSRINGKVERYHRTLHEAASAFLYDARLSPIFWPYAVMHAEWIKNRVIHRELGTNITPHEIVTRRRPRADRVRVFGSDMYEYMHDSTEKSTPGRARARKLIYLGVPPDSASGYLGFDPTTRSLRVVYDVTFDESMANRANNLNTYDEARQGVKAQEELAFDTQKSKVEGDQVRQVFDTNLDAGKTEPVGVGEKKTDDDKDESMDTSGDTFTRLHHFPTNFDTDGDMGNTDTKVTKKSVAAIRLRRNKRRPTPWAETLPTVKPFTDDDFIGSYVQIPFKDGYFFGIITSKASDEIPDGEHKGYNGYFVTFEDGEELEFDAPILEEHIVEDDHVRTTKKPSKKILDAVHRRKPTAEDEDREGNDLNVRRAPPRRSHKLQSHLLQTRALVGTNHPSHINGPLNDKALEEYYRRELLEQRDGHIRPHRLESIGTPVQRSKADNDFIKVATEQKLPVQYILDNPKTKGSASHERYNRYCFCETLNDVVAISIATRKKGVSKSKAEATARADIRHDYEHAYIMFPQNESLLDGHVYNAKQLARDNKVNCRADTLMHIGPRALHVALGTKLGESLHDQLLEEKKLADALKYGENPTALNALMKSELKKIEIYDPVNDTWHLEPASSKEAHAGPDSANWRVSEETEMAALEKFGTYDLITELPRSDDKGNRVLPMSGRFVYKLKTDDNGRLRKWKARLVARGFMSREGIDHQADEVFAPVMSYDSFRTIMAIAAGNGWTVRQTDISNAYLQGHLHDRDGNEKHDPLKRVCEKTGKPYYLKLKRPLYGLKQSGYRWCIALHNYLLDNKFKRSPTDPCVFTITVSRTKVLEYMNCSSKTELPDVSIDPETPFDAEDHITLQVGSYVDDILFTGSDQLALDWFDNFLAKKFEINPTDTGEAHHALGARIRQDREKGFITMDQTAAIERLAEMFKVHTTVPNAMNATPATLDALPKLKETTTDFPYLSAVGSLLHIAGLTRPDIAWATGAVARHGSAFGEVHVRAVKRIIAYLYHTRFHGLVYRSKASIPENSPLRRVQDAVLFESGRPPIMTKDGETRLQSDPYQIFCDADFAGDTTRRSTCGIITFLNCGPISWTSRLMKLQALSTTESEIYAATEAIKDAAYLKAHLSALRVRENVAIPVHEDNSACVTMGVSYLKTYNKARHYVTRLNFLQERVHDKTVQLVPTPTKEQIADVMTKPLSGNDFSRFRDIIVKNVRQVILPVEIQITTSNFAHVFPANAGFYERSEAFSL